MAQRFAVGEVNPLAALTENGANFGAMGLKSFEPIKLEMNVSQPAPTIGGLGR